MTPIDAATLKQGRLAVQAMSAPGIVWVAMFLMLVVALTGCGFLIWRTEVRADAQIEVMKAMAKEIGMLRADFRAHGVRAAAVQAVERE